MTSTHFKNVAHTLATACGNAGVSLDVYGILHLAEALIDMGFDATEPVEEPSLHDTLVALALDSHEVVANAGQKKIVAIKALRALAHCSLKEAKDAVEDERVQVAANLYSDPWSIHHDRGEPPF